MFDRRVGRHGCAEPVCTGLVELVREDSKGEKSACEASLSVDTLTHTHTHTHTHKSFLSTP